MENRGGDHGPIDLDMMTSVLEPEKTSSGGLHVPGKDRLVFRPAERKSLLGLDVLTNLKRDGSKGDGAFKVPRERVTSVVKSMDEEENSAASGLDEAGSEKKKNSACNYTGRKYRETYASGPSNSDITVTEERQVSDTPTRHNSKEHIRSEIVAVSPGSSRYARSPSYDTGDRDGSRSYSRDGGRSYSRDDSKSETRGTRRRHGTDGEERN